MIYATSDLHGYSLRNFQSLMRSAGFKESDFLFILGDIADRGEYGAELLVWLLDQPNVQLVLGNHEAMMLSCDFLFEQITEESVASLSAEKLALFSTWSKNGASPTIKALRELAKKDEYIISDIFDYLRDAPLYEAVSAGGHDFLLTHSGLGNFRPDKKLSEYTADDFLWNRPSPEDTYYTEIHTVFGHTPTMCLSGVDNGKAFKTATWTAIDTGSGFGGNPMLLRLDDMKEFYV